MNVLVVDDVELTRMMLVRGLKGIGIENVFEADDGIAAIRVFDDQDIDVVFTDWNMPRMNGVELLKKIRERSADCAVIMITAESTRGAVLQAVQAGASDYLVKPFDPPTLREKLAKWTVSDEVGA